MCSQLPLFETGECSLVRRYAGTSLFLREVPFSINFAPHSTLRQEVVPEGRLALEWHHSGGSQSCSGESWSIRCFAYQKEEQEAI